MGTYLPTVLLLMGLIFTGCGDNGERTFTTSLQLRDQTGSPAREFQEGATVTFVLSITNEKGSPQVIHLLTTQKFEIIVASEFDAPPLWHWSSTQLTPLPILTDIVFSPGETKAFQVDWPQVDDVGFPLFSGDYLAQGFIATPRELSLDVIAGETETRSKTVVFRIK